MVMKDLVVSCLFGWYCFGTVSTDEETSVVLKKLLKVTIPLFKKKLLMSTVRLSLP